jgi:hypothetical protein
VSTYLTPFDPSASSGGTIDTALGKDRGTLLVWNDSATNIHVTLADGSRWPIPSGWARRLDVGPGNDPISWTQEMILPVVPPNSQVYIQSFSAAEAENIQEVYPAALVRSLSIPGSTVVATLSNEGNAAGTLVIDIGPVTLGPLIDIYNDHFNWSVDQSGTAHQVLKGQTSGNPLQIGQAGDTTEVLGFLTLDNAIIGSVTLSSGQLTITAPSSTQRGLIALFPSLAASDQPIISGAVTGDANPRTALYIRGSSTDGYGGIRAGKSVGGITAHLYAQANGWQMDEALVGIGGQATVGTFGVPPIVAEGIDVADTGSSSITVLTLTPTAGKYRLGGLIQYQTTTTQTVTLSVTYTDPRLGSITVYFSSPGGLLNGLSTVTNSMISVTPLYISASAATLTVTYLNSAVAANDHISIYMERLS